MDKIIDAIGPIAHPASLISVAGAFVGILPPLAALVGIAWYVILIYESRTFQHWNRNRQMKRKARKVAHLRAQEKIILAELDALEIVRVARVDAHEKIASATAQAAKDEVREATQANIKSPLV